MQMENLTLTWLTCRKWRNSQIVNFIPLPHCLPRGNKGTLHDHDVLGDLRGW